MPYSGYIFIFCHLFCELLTAILLKIGHSKWFKMDKRQSFSILHSLWQNLATADPTSANDTSRPRFFGEGRSRWLGVTRTRVERPDQSNMLPPSNWIPWRWMVRWCWCQWPASLYNFSIHEHMAGSKSCIYRIPKKCTELISKYVQEAKKWCIHLYSKIKKPPEEKNLKKRKLPVLQKNVSRNLSKHIASHRKSPPFPLRIYGFLPSTLSEEWDPPKVPFFPKKKIRCRGIKTWGSAGPQKMRCLKDIHISMVITNILENICLLYNLSARFLFQINSFNNINKVLNFHWSIGERISVTTSRWWSDPTSPKNWNDWLLL